MSSLRPIILGVGGFQSNVGKTTLLCELLKQLPGWEAIKTTRGHYRSCGKDPHSCCVSHLLGDQPVVYSDKQHTYVAGKDTGRYWDAGASNVHWVIATEEQVEQGILAALARVRAPGVLIEGNSFLNFVNVDAMFMVAGASTRKMKSSARRAIARADSLVLTAENLEAISADEVAEFRQWLGSLQMFSSLKLPPIYSWQERDELLKRVHQLTTSIAA